MKRDKEIKPGDAYVQSLAKGLEVICTFRPDAQYLTLTDVAKRCDLTRAGARRILLTLVAVGMARQEGRLFSINDNVTELTLGACAPRGQP